MKRSECIVRRIPDITPNGYHAAKIRAYAAAYGHRYPNVDLSFYTGDGFTAMVYNNTVTVAGIPRDREMYRYFIQRIGSGKFIETADDSALELDGWYRTQLIHMRGRADGRDDGVVPADAYAMSDAVSTYFDIDRDMWYTDMSHRIRHGVSRIYTCGGSYAAVDFHAYGMMYVSCVVSPEEVRGKGNIRRILSHISDLGVIDLRYDPYQEGLSGFYEHMGLMRVGEDMLWDNEVRRMSMEPDDFARILVRNTKRAVRYDRRIDI